MGILLAGAPNALRVLELDAVGSAVAIGIFSSQRGVPLVAVSDEIRAKRITSNIMTVVTAEDIPVRDT